MSSLKDRIAWVTGGGSGIGAAAATSLARAGAIVYVSGRRTEPLFRVIESIETFSGNARELRLDVGDAAAVEEAAGSIVDAHGRIDVLVHSAGMNIRERSWANSTPEDFDALMRANLNGAYYCCRSVLPTMRANEGGLIVAISSWAGRHASRLAGGAYSASKHGLNALVETINMEECVHGIRATALCPGEVATAILDDRPEPPDAAARSRMLQPEDMGEIVAFLAGLPARVCVNDLLVSPTWNRAYVGNRKG